MSFGDNLAAVFGRYDGQVMQPPQRPPEAVRPEAWAPLQAWCMEGAGPGGSSFWQAGALPAVQRRFAAAQWMGPDQVAETWALMLDGSDQLAALDGRANQLLLRLWTKIDDACWWRKRRPRDPWDAGHLIDSEAAVHQLQQHFMPRRATLLIAGAIDSARLAASLTALQQRSPLFRHPVRLLCLASASLAADPAGAGVTRLSPPVHLAL